VVDRLGPWGPGAGDRANRQGRARRPAGDRLARPLRPLRRRLRRHGLARPPPGDLSDPDRAAAPAPLTAEAGPDAPALASDPARYRATLAGQARCFPSSPTRESIR